MEIKYVICPGHVTSKNDGQHHYIGARNLMMLYGVDPRNCVVYDPTSEHTGINRGSRQSLREELEERYPGLPWLGPRYHGDYDLPAT